MVVNSKEGVNVIIPLTIYQYTCCDIHEGMVVFELVVSVQNPSNR
jgi:hypothetical protein